MNTDTNPITNASHQTNIHISDPDASRFWEKVKQDDSYCWEWTAYTDRDGYGRFSLRGTKHRAHRIAVVLSGRDPAGKKVRHACDNPSCVNPDHLMLGSQRDNMDDMVRRDRQPRGSRNGQAKLTEEQADAIRVSSRSSPELAAEYGVSDSHVRMIKTGRAWTHLAE